MIELIISSREKPWNQTPILIFLSFFLKTNKKIRRSTVESSVSHVNLSISSIKRPGGYCHDITQALFKIRFHCTLSSTRTSWNDLIHPKNEKMQFDHDLHFHERGISGDESRALRHPRQVGAAAGFNSVSSLASQPRTRCPRPWVLDAGMYEPLYLAFDAYPTVVPRVRVRGVMALFLAVSILWALIW